MNVRYRVELSQAEREELTAMLSGGKHAARKLKRAQILLAADIGSRDEEIARTIRVSASTVYRTKRRFVEGNLDRALSEEPRPGASCAALSSTTPRNTPVGLTWSRSACSKGNVSAAGSRIQNASKMRSQHGSGSETKLAPASTGCSQQTKLAPNWGGPIQACSKSQNHCDEPLAWISTAKTPTNVGQAN
jgi:hypothetical protein